MAQEALTSSDASAGRFIADLQGQIKTLKAERTALLNNLDQAKQENDMLVASNDHMLSSNGTLQSNV
jgi:FtsZ-binding cell division protein ZapB